MDEDMLDAGDLGSDDDLDLDGDDLAFGAMTDEDFDDEFGGDGF